LKGATDGADEPPVRWFTTGAKRWHEAASWPPPAQTERVYLAPARTLVTDPTTTTGTTSRWHGLAVPTWTEYGDRAAADRHLVVYETEPLPQAKEITGHPVVSLAVRCDRSDGALFAYLEDVDPSGRVGYVSEGWLRALQRRQPRTYARADALPLVPGERAVLVFELLPLSHEFGPGHRIRLALAGADRDQFALPAGPPPTFEIEAGPDSWLDLPVVTGN
jgi:putative CocE/NonD family hydrolase